MSWLTALQDFRIRLSDGPTDRIHWRKRCFGQSDGVNNRFKTFEFRRVTDFTIDNQDDTGIYVGGVKVPPSGVVSDNLRVGEFALLVPPAEAVEVEATYYTQWFIDAELEDFLRQAARTLINSDNYVAIVPGLTTSALEFASSRAYTKMAQRWREHMSNVYQLANDPKPDPDSPVDSFNKMAKDANEEHARLTKFFYTRQNQNLQPLWATVVGNVRNMP